MKTTYEIRQIDALNDGFWFWNESYHIGEFETSSDNAKRPFMKALKKLGIIFKKGTIYVDYNGHIFEVRNRKTDEPYFAAIPVETLD